MPRIAFTTIGVLHEHRTHPKSEGFATRSPLVMQLAEASDGFMARSVLNYETLEQSWGQIVLPSFVPPEREANVAQTLSLWEDLESVYAFTYSAGVHSEALRLREEWFRPPDHPNYAAWWVGDNHQPDFIEATRALETLHANGPSPAAFNFKQPFDAEGRPSRLEAALAKAKAARNAAAQAASVS
jgi:hypothetical protein